MDLLGLLKEAVKKAEEEQSKKDGKKTWKVDECALILQCRMTAPGENGGPDSAKLMNLSMGTIKGLDGTDPKFLVQG